eukprot:s873_g7.t1
MRLAKLNFNRVPRARQHYRRFAVRSRANAICHSRCKPACQERRAKSTSIRAGCLGPDSYSLEHNGERLKDFDHTANFLTSKTSRIRQMMSLEETASSVPSEVWGCVGQWLSPEDFARLCHCSLSLVLRREQRRMWQYYCHLEGYAQRVDALDLGHFWTGPEVNWHRCFELNRLIKSSPHAFAYVRVGDEDLRIPAKCDDGNDTVASATQAWLFDHGWRPRSVLSRVLWQMLEPCDVPHRFRDLIVGRPGMLMRLARFFQQTSATSASVEWPIGRSPSGDWCWRMPPYTAEDAAAAEKWEDSPSVRSGPHPWGRGYGWLIELNLPDDHREEMGIPLNAAPAPRWVHVGSRLLAGKFLHCATGILRQHLCQGFAMAGHSAAVARCQGCRNLDGFVLEFIFEALRISISDLSFPPDVVLCSSVLTSCGRAEEWQQALGLMEEALGQRLQADATFYNAGLSAVSTRWPWTLELLARMLRADMAPDTFTMNSALSGLVRGDQWRMAVQVMKEMESMRADSGWPNALALLSTLQRRKLRFDTVTLNAAIRRMAASACEASWRHALQLWQQMQRQQLAPDSITFGALINACGKAGCWQMAVAILEVAKRSKKADFPGTPRLQASAVAFHSAVYGCDVCGRWEKALELMEALVDAELEEPPG